MSGMSPVPEPIQKHVPAWKKLGLKLKFAKEEPEVAQPSQNDRINHKKRKAPAKYEAVVEKTPVERSAKKVKKSTSREEEAGEAVNGNGTSHEPRDENKPGKKVKQSNPNTEDSTEAVNANRKSSSEPTNTERPSKKADKSKVKAGVSRSSVHGKFSSTHEQESSPPPTLSTTPASKRKSVSFTPDTKSKDGDSVKGLYKSWIANQIATDPSFDPSTVSPALRSIVPSTVPPPKSPVPSSVIFTSTSNSEPNTKDSKKPPKKPKTSSGLGPSRFDPVLTYLTAHHTSPETWKFSKPHQNQILKHLFSLNHIPSSYDTALLPYIRGLKGASARSRVREEALEVREEDKKWLAAEPSEIEKMENETTAQCNARRLRDYEAAVARIKQTLREKEEEREERDWELLGEKAEWEERIRKRRRAEIILWDVGEEEETAEADSVALPQHDTFGGDARHGQMNSGMAHLAQAARDPGPAPRVGRGVGMGMGGVEVIDAGGIARGSRGKKVVFGDDGAAQARGSKDRVHGFGGANGVVQVNGVKMPDVGHGANGVKPKRKRKHRRRTGVPDDDDTSSSSSESSSSSSEESEEEQQQQQPQKVVVKGVAEESSDDDTSSSSEGVSDSD